MVLPLSGIRVIEVTRDIAGPYCGMALADVGAEVLKVERPKTDPYRDGGPIWKAAKFVNYNRNKKSVAVNLESADGKMVMSRLIKTADVFLENLPPRAADRMGFSYEEVSKLNPRIIYCSIKSYLPGPYGERDVEDTIIESQAGYPQWTGTEAPEQPLTTDSPPLKLGVPITSFGAGEYAAVAIVGALLNRMKAGQGDYIRVGAFETGFNLLAPSPYSQTKKRRKQSAICYKLKDGRWMEGSYGHIGTSDDRWKAFCDAFGISKDEYEATDTKKKRDALGGPVMETMISKYFSQFTFEEARKKIVDNNLVVGAVATMREVLQNDQLKSKLIPLVVDPEVGMTNTPITVSHLMLPIRSKDYNPQATGHWKPAPRLGQDTVNVLHELGYTEDQIKDLNKREII